jgi:hypothetical protein
VAAQTSFSITTVAHESLADVCTILDSFQTPLFSSAPKIRATDVVHSWVIDTLVAAQTANAADASAFNNAWPTQTAPARLQNAVVTFSNNIEVGDQARAINPAGIRDFYDHQVMKSFKQIARDCESWLFSTGASASAEATSVVHAASGYGMFGFPMVVSNAPGGVTTADIIRISESLFNAGAEPDSMWFAPAQKRQFVVAVSGSSVNARNIAAADKSIVQNVDVYESPFNQLYAVITDRFIPTSTVSASAYGYFIGDRAMAKIAFLRPPQHKPMGKAGDSTRGIVLMDLTLQLDHPSAWGRVTGCTNG